ncbi:MAG: J domain-containing protein [Elainellaceae cyanobacterium]
MSADYYQLLELHPEASQLDVKQAYRRLAKRFHPDSNRTIRDHDRISHINAAYEVLGDPHKRRQYDIQLRYSSDMDSRRASSRSSADYGRRQGTQRRNTQTQSGSAAYGSKRCPSPGQTSDAQLQTWLTAVYRPIDQQLSDILGSLDSALDQLALDPFDDELMDEFLNYIESCRLHLDRAQHIFRSVPNPANVAAAASGLYYCLNQVGDALDEFERFTSCYNEHYIHTGQELFRISRQLHRESQDALQNLV